MLSFAFTFGLVLAIAFSWSSTPLVLPPPAGGGGGGGGPPFSPTSEACIKVCSGKMPSRNCYECHHQHRGAASHQEGGTGPEKYTGAESVTETGAGVHREVFGATLQGHSIETYQLADHLKEEKF